MCSRSSFGQADLSISRMRRKNSKSEACSTGVPDMDPFPPPLIALLSEPRALQPAISPIQDVTRGEARASCPAVPRTHGAPPVPTPPQQRQPRRDRATPRLPRSMPRPVDQVECHPRRSMCRRICPRRRCVTWLWASWRRRSEQLLPHRAHDKRAPASDRETTGAGNPRRLWEVSRGPWIGQLKVAEVPPAGQPEEPGAQEDQGGRLRNARGSATASGAALGLLTGHRDAKQVT